MKRCPRCGQVYSDDLIYCLQDGSELLPQQPEFETETATVIRPPRTPSEPRKPYLKYLAIGLTALVLMMAAGAVGAYLVWTKVSRTDENGTAPMPFPSSTPRQNSNNSARNDADRDRPVNAEPSPDRTKTPAANNHNSLSNSGEDYTDPGTTRIAFRRGRESETVSGRIARSRSFVLRTLVGQYLTATVSSTGDCVIFSDGSTAIDFSTPAGDSRIALRNNCPAPVRFDMKVTVK